MAETQKNTDNLTDQSKVYVLFYTFDMCCYGLLCCDMFFDVLPWFDMCLYGLIYMYILYIYVFYIF